MDTLRQDRWDGRYFDGYSTTPHRVSITISNAGLEIAKIDGTVFHWYFHQIRQSQGTYTGEQVRLEKGDEMLVVDDPVFLQAIHYIAPNRSSFHNPRFRRHRTALTVLSAVAIIVIGLVFYFRGIPTLTDLVVVYLPVRWEEELGAQVVSLLAPENRRIDDPDCQKAIEGIADLLLKTEQSSPYHMHIILKRDPIINAFAAPGGYIVIHDGLLKKTKSPEELAAVLAHEIQHILQRHSTRAILRELSIGMLLSALSGDAGGLHYALETVHTLGGLRFRRQDEAEADQKGMQMLQKAKIDPKGMVVFFETLKKEVGDIPRFLSYVSTHPRTEERIERLKQIADQSDYESVALLPDTDWSEIQKMCARRPK
ncbi:MAG: M48 family metallopeptidase [Gemmatimonadetes bacterium]|nr:M48 family metallopeptidase [Gemmatimonadota bacterium]